MMGDETGDLYKTPQHEVYTDAFYMDEHPVTNEQYRKFVEATGHREPEGTGYVNGKLQGGLKPWKDRNFNKPEQPVVCVRWEDASAYAEWVGGRLPTEAEWEKAARGGLVGKKYPNGDTISHDDANYGKQQKGTMLVKKYPPNGYGLYDMAGNVWEWCSDWWDADYYEKSPKDNPTGPSSGSYHVFRGGSWYSGASRARCGFRAYFNIIYCGINVGFRVVVASGVFE